MIDDDSVDPVDPEDDPADGSNVTDLHSGRSIADMAKEGPEIPQPPPLKGDGQLTLGGLGPAGKRKIPIEAEVSLMSAAVPVDGMLKPDVEGQLIVSYQVHSYKHVPVRNEVDEIVRYKLRIQVRPVSIVRAGTEAGDVALAAVSAVGE